MKPNLMNALFRIASNALLLAALFVLAAPPAAHGQTYQANPAWGGPKGERPLIGSKPGGHGAGDPTTKDGPGGGAGTPGTPTRVPVDGGLALLAAAGAAYAARRLRTDDDAPAST
jgi:hypothetical protein